MKHQNNRVGRELLAYGNLVESDVVKLHKYIEVEQRTEFIARGETFEQSLIKPLMADMSISTKGMVGHSSSPSWESVNRSHSHQGHADMHFMIDIVEKNVFFLWSGMLGLDLFSVHTICLL